MGSKLIQERSTEKASYIRNSKGIDIFYSNEKQTLEGIKNKNDMIEYKQYIIEEDTMGPFNFMYYNKDDTDGKFSNADTVAECKELIDETTRSLSPIEYFYKACEVLGVEPETIKSKDRHREVLMGRAAIATKLLQRFPLLALVKLGKMIGRDHATIIYYRDRFVGTDLFYKCIKKLEAEI